ncbi:MAG: HAD family hydrolase [Endomicrobiales bacterium]|nr:HAD family hydrolase [Endomicrobiales bacterium]
MEKRTKKNIAVFLDRDGTIIRERHYLRKVKDIRILSGTVESLSLLRKAGYKLILVTNQSGIGRGYLTKKKLALIHTHLKKLLKKKGVYLDALYYCPHAPGDNCSCRKPKLGMVKLAQKRLNIDLKKSFTIGDHVNDFLLGQNMGGTGIFLLTGHGKEELEKINSSGGRLKPDRIEQNLLAAAKWILGQKKK